MLDLAFPWVSKYILLVLKGFLNRPRDLAILYFKKITGIPSSSQRRTNRLVKQMLKDILYNIYIGK